MDLIHQEECKTSLRLLQLLGQLNVLRLQEQEVLKACLDNTGHKLLQKRLLLSVSLFQTMEFVLQRSSDFPHGLD